MMKMIKTEEKICEICLIRFNRKPGYPIKQWITQKTCSGKCRSILLKKMNVGFQKGHKSFSEKGRFSKGLTPWNKGKSGLQVAWNKGKIMKRPVWSQGRKLSEETKQKIKQARANQVFPKGKNHWSWKGGTSGLRKLIQKLNFYTNWRKQIFERDNYTCQLCEQRGGKLHADHKKSYSLIIEEYKIKTVEQAKKCLELWDISNGRTLCVRCHMATDNYGGKSNKKIIT